MKTLEFTAECKGKHVTGLPGVFFEDSSEEADYERCCEELQWRCEQAYQCGIVFSVEPHLGSIIPTPQAAMRLVKDVPVITYTLDYTHFVRIGMPDKDIEPLVPYASHFHVRGAAEGLLQTSFAKNTIDYGRLIKLLKEVKYEGYIGIEYTWQDWEHCNETDNVSEVILFRDFFREQAE